MNVNADGDLMRALAPFDEAQRRQGPPPVIIIHWSAAWLTLSDDDDDGDGRNRLENDDA
jgi:hypothetical protein